MKKNVFKTFNSILKLYVSSSCIKLLPILWNEKHRFYHNVSHLEQIIEDIEKTPSFKYLNIYEKHALLLGCFMHDIIYDPKKKDNEDQSIRFFKSFYISKDQKMPHLVSNLIETTKYRKRPLNRLERIFWDADNAKFRDGYDTLLKNEGLLQKEYSFLSKKEYKENRIKFLKSNIGLFDASIDKDIRKLIEYINKK